MATRLQYLFERHLSKTSTPEERLELMGMALEHGLQKEIQEIIAAVRDKVGEEADVSEEKAEAILQQIFPEKESGLVIDGAKKFSWLRIAAAASIIIMLGIGSYFIFFNKDDKEPEIVKTSEPVDVRAPQTNRAMITLANGKKVYLDSVSSGQLAMQGNVKLVKLANGQIAYQTAGGEIIKELQFNTLSNPRGSNVIDMTLADGSRVWLNAGSSVTYPVAFVGSERKVSITGEAYFEVAHDASKPFYVSKGDVQVRVLGTHFNVNAYDDEADIKVTLLEGSVKVSKGNTNRLLKPGEQAKISTDLEVEKNVDLEQVMAWKNGQFFLKGTDIQALMRQAARWYDVDIVFNNKVPEIKFGGSIGRDVNISTLLEALKEHGVKCRLEGKKVVIE